MSGQGCMNESGLERGCGLSGEKYAFSLEICILVNFRGAFGLAAAAHRQCSCGGAENAGHENARHEIAGHAKAKQKTSSEAANV